MPAVRANPGATLAAWLSACTVAAFVVLANDAYAFLHFRPPFLEGETVSVFRGSRGEFTGRLGMRHICQRIKSLEILAAFTILAHYDFFRIGFVISRSPVRLRRVAPKFKPLTYLFAKSHLL